MSVNRPELDNDRKEHPEWYDESGYMNVNHPLATEDLAKQDKMDWMEDYDECPVCKGYGVWHLVYNAYGEDKHFNRFCSNCSGRGYTKKNPDTGKACEHKWKHKRKIGRYANEYTCELCGIGHTIDSGD